MGCLCGAPSEPASRCHVQLTAQLSQPGSARCSEEGTPVARGPSARPSVWRISQSAATAAAVDTFTPPQAFPGLASTVARAVAVSSHAKRVDVQACTVAPSAGGPLNVSIAITLDATFAPPPRRAAAAGDGGAAAAFRASLLPPAVTGLEEDIMAALCSDPPQGIAVVLGVMVTAGGGTRREEGASVHRMRRPSAVPLRVSGNTLSIEEELRNAPPGTFSFAPPPPPPA